MKKVFVVLFLIASTPSWAQELTTYILVRHAEKVLDGTSDPALTKEGEDRANNLLALLEKTVITTIYSTNYKRTKKTVEPLAEAKKIKIITYNPKNLKKFYSRLIKNDSGGTIVISGHSNTTPALANLLLGEEKFKQFEDDDYGNLLIIVLDKNNNGQLLHLRF